MLKYFVIVSPAHATSRTQSGIAAALISFLRSQPEAWQTVLETDGLTALIARGPACATAVPLSYHRGVILGEIFHTPQSAESGARTRVLSLDDSETHGILTSHGRELVSRYWGNYVAILRDPGTDSTFVLRGPMAFLPCLHVSADGTDIYFSCMETLASFGRLKFNINWRQVARQLLGPLLSDQTGLNEVRECLPGTCHKIGPNRRSVVQYWDPVTIARDNSFSNFSSAAVSLRQTTAFCTRAWTQNRRRVLHCLSGGLDSSIVLGCLNRPNPITEVICVTHFAEGTDGDERRYARSAARGLRLRHIERSRAPPASLAGILNGSRLAKCPGMSIPEVDRIDPDCALEVGAEGIFRGHGGDELFCRHHTFYYLADFLRERGPRAEFGSLLLHSAVTEGVTVWASLWRALVDGCLPRRWSLTDIFWRDLQGQSFLTAECIHDLTRPGMFDLPFATSTAVCPPGKLWQVSLVVASRDFHGPHSRDDDPDVISPLLSQPVVEVCLQIPTYFQIRNRGERAVARTAFRGLVPDRILRRRSKGGAEDLAWRVLRNNWAFARELLLDGELIKERLVDRGRLEMALLDSHASDVRATVPLFGLLGVEAWLRRLAQA
jgi:asparagine synthase (glutamine-hydrolysing)